MKLPVRKWKVQFHFKSGRTIVAYCDDLTIGIQNNKITQLKYPGAKIIDHIRLDEIEAITSRRSLFHWRFPC